MLERVLVILCVLPLSYQDHCEGIQGKAMRKLKWGKVVLEEEMMYEEKRKEFKLKQPGVMVQEHYADLPYPPFSLSDMAREMSYYVGTVRDRPFFQQFTNNLDMLNHHLYRV